MKTTRYFEEQVLRKRPYILKDWCRIALEKPLEIEIQSDGRSRRWVAVRLDHEDEDRYLRVVVLEDGETVHNAFLDRGFPRVRL